MTALASDTVLLVLLAFCRVGACFLVLPGISSSRVPVQVRLLLVVAITIATVYAAFVLYRLTRREATPPAEIEPYQPITAQAPHTPELGPIRE